MIFQKVLKGIGGISDSVASQMLTSAGIVCGWWNRVGRISPAEVKEKLTEDNLFWHLERYDDVHPTTGRPFNQDTPYISTTAGSVQRDQLLARNVFYPPLLTAILFATSWFQRPGYVFYGYVYVLGKKSVPLQEFAEEVRELNIYTSWLRFHEEGEIVAKIILPSTRLSRVERYEPSQSLRDLRRGVKPAPAWTLENPTFCAPEGFSNVRDVIL
jgi:hypothetical protein